MLFRRKSRWLKMTPPSGGCVFPNATPTIFTRGPMVFSSQETSLLTQFTFARIHIMQYCAEGLAQINMVNPPEIKIAPPGIGVTIETSPTKIRITAKTLITVFIFLSIIPCKLKIKHKAGPIITCLNDCKTLLIKVILHFILLNE